MIRALFILLLLHASVVQEDYPVKKLWLFSKMVYSGNVPRLPNGGQGNGRNKKMICYVEVAKDQALPAWQNANISGQLYTVEATPVSQDSVAVGFLKNTRSAIVIKAVSGDKLIQLMLTRPVETPKREDSPVVLSGTLNGKPVSIRSKETAVELAPEQMP